MPKPARRRMAIGPWTCGLAVLVRSVRVVLLAIATTAAGGTPAYAGKGAWQAGQCPGEFADDSSREAAAALPSSPDAGKEAPRPGTDPRPPENLDAQRLALHARQGQRQRPEGGPLDILDVQNSVPVPGLTGAPPALQRDVLRMLLAIDRVLDGACSQRTLVDTECLTWNQETRTAAERWTLMRCGKTIRYRVIFMPAGQGGTVFSIQIPGDE